MELSQVSAYNEARDGARQFTVQPRVTVTNHGPLKPKLGNEGHEVENLR